MYTSGMRYLSTFTGIGGFEVGIHRVFGETAECIGYSEIDKPAIKTYEEHYEHHNYGDITAIESAGLPDFDLIVGGFPCQAFSVAGKRRGFDEARGTLFFDVARICADKRPRHLVLENVKGLLSHDGGKTFTTILGVLADLGYRMEWQVLNSISFGVPQGRERTYLVGHLRDQCAGQIFPFTVKASIRYSGSTLTTRYPGAWREGIYIIEEGEKYRDLTPVETERLQGFPDNWTVGSDAQRYKQCGNAVTTNVVEAVMAALNKEGCI
jgi:DNA (cytosine-5)-methyltransferase 1